MTRRAGLTSFIGQRWAVLFLLVELVFFSSLARRLLHPERRADRAVLQHDPRAPRHGGDLRHRDGRHRPLGGVRHGLRHRRLGEARRAASPTWASPAGLALLLAILITLAIGLLPGLVNGLLVARLKVPPFLATFAVQGITYGISLLLTQGSAAINVPNLANVIGNGYFLYLVPGQGCRSSLRPRGRPGHARSSRSSRPWSS